MCVYFTKTEGWVFVPACKYPEKCHVCVPLLTGAVEIQVEILNLWRYAAIITPDDSRDTGIDGICREIDPLLFIHLLTTDNFAQPCNN